MWLNLSVTCDRSVVSSTNKIDRHDITEILLKMVLNVITLTLLIWKGFFFSLSTGFDPLFWYTAAPIIKPDVQWMRHTSSEEPLSWLIVICLMSSGNYFMHIQDKKKTTIYKYYTERREEWDNWGKDFDSLEKYGKLKRNQKFSLMLLLQSAYTF